MTRKQADSHVVADATTGHRTDWPGPPVDARAKLETKAQGKDGRWHKMNQDYLSIMAATDAVVLSFLFNWRERWAGKLPPQYRHAGRFYCAVKSMEQHLWMNGDCQRRIFRRLKKRGYIETEQHRKPSGVGQPVRWIRINAARIVVDMDAVANEASLWNEEFEGQCT